MQVLVFAGRDIERMGKGDGVGYIGRFCLRPFHVEVDHHYFPADAAHDQRICRRSSNESASDYADFHIVSLSLVASAPRA